MKENSALSTERSSSAEPVKIDLGHFAPYLVSRLHTHFQNLLLETLNPYELLVADWRTLICLSRHETACINDIVHFTSLPQATVSRSVMRLQKRGLLMKTDAKDDKRASLVCISRAGRELLQRSIRQLRPAAQAELRRLIGSDSEVFLEMLREAVRNSGLETVHDL
jgi:DNA-binding MarR family transcriptional regulator